MSWGIIFRRVSLTLLQPLGSKRFLLKRSRLWPACSNLNLGTWPSVHPICRNTIPRTYTGFQTSCVPLLQIKTKYVVPSTSFNHHLVEVCFSFHYHFGPIHGFCGPNLGLWSVTPVTPWHQDYKNPVQPIRQKEPPASSVGHRGAQHWSSTYKTSHDDNAIVGSVAWLGKKRKSYSSYGFEWKTLVQKLSL